MNENVDPKSRSTKIPKPTSITSKLHQPSQTRKSLEERSSNNASSLMPPPTRSVSRTKGANTSSMTAAKSKFQQNGMTDPLSAKRAQSRPHSAQSIRSDETQEERMMRVQGMLDKSEDERMHSLASEIQRLKTEKYQWELEKSKIQDELEDCKKENEEDRKTFREQEWKIRNELEKRLEEKEKKIDKKDEVITEKESKIYELMREKIEAEGALSVQVGNAKMELREEFEREKAIVKDQCDKELRQGYQKMYDDEVEKLKNDFEYERQKIVSQSQEESSRSQQLVKQIEMSLNNDKKRFSEEMEHEVRKNRQLQDQLREALEQLESERHETQTLRNALANVSASSNSMESVAKSQQAQIDELQYQLDQQKQKASESRAYAQQCQEEGQTAKSKLLKEEILRRKLHNQVQELKGNIRVFCRVRPKLEHESDSAAQIEFPDLDEESSEIVLTEKVQTATGTSQKLLPFQFDRVFGPQSTNTEVFDEISQLVQSALDGYNVCIFAYGQTGSGKTYTMSADNDGMIPQTVSQIFQTAEQMKERGWTYSLEGQFLEIYNENLNDLLGKSDMLDKSKLEIRHDTNEKTTAVTDLSTIPLTSPEQVYHVLNKASKNRSVAATKMNERSSRSHSVFMLHIKGSNSITGKSLKGTLNLIDLAGSERLAQSQVTGDRLKETQSINKSLSALGDVIYSLGTNNGHVPYRNSKLTYLLQYSLSGNSKTLMFVNVSPLEPHVNETISSLRFATKVNNTRIRK